MKTIGLLFAATLLPCVRLAAAGSGDFPAMPSNPAELQPLASHDTPAYQAARLFQHGVNLGNFLEVPPGQNWGGEVTVTEIAQMKREGFDHVRVPIGWHHYAGPAPEFTIAPEMFARVDAVVTNALADGLAVMINIHHFNELDADPVATTPEFLALWKQIAAHYASYPPHLAFELDNEPHDNATTALMNPIYAQAIAEIRASNPHRTIFAEPGHWGSIDELKNLVLPPDDNVIVSVHCYEPFRFTHQGAGWAGPDEKQTGIHFPGPPAQPLVPDARLNLKPYVLDWINKYHTLPAEKNPGGPAAFTGRLAFVQAWSAYYGRPVHLGEFGAYEKIDLPSRVNFYSAMRHAAEERHIGWCLWAWGAGFEYWDNQNGRALPGMHAALFAP